MFIRVCLYSEIDGAEVLKELISDGMMKPEPTRMKLSLRKH